MQRLFRLVGLLYEYCVPLHEYLLSEELFFLRRIDSGVNIVAVRNHSQAVTLTA